MFRDFRNSPIVFWALAAISIFSAWFAVYTYQITKPSRELSYRAYFRGIGTEDKLDINFSIKGASEEISFSNGYIHTLYVWNSGNTDIETSNILSAITVKLSEGDRLIKTSTKNMKFDQIDFEIKGQDIILNISKMLPKAGIVISYFSPTEMIGSSVNGLIADPVRGAIVPSGSAVGFDFMRVNSRLPASTLFVFCTFIMYGTIPLTIGVWTVRSRWQWANYLIKFIVTATTAAVSIVLFFWCYNNFATAPPF